MDFSNLLLFPFFSGESHKRINKEDIQLKFTLRKFQGQGLNLKSITSNFFHGFFPESKDGLLY